MVVFFSIVVCLKLGTYVYMDFLVNFLFFGDVIIYGISWSGTRK